MSSADSDNFASESLRALKVNSDKFVSDYERFTSRSSKSAPSGKGKESVVTQEQVVASLESMSDSLKVVVLNLQKIRNKAAGASADDTINEDLRFFEEVNDTVRGNGKKILDYSNHTNSWPVSKPKKSQKLS